MTNKIRLRMDLKLYENGELVLRTTKRMKSQARLWVEAGLTPERTGKCRVWYNKELDYWNEFEFTNLKEFNEILSTDTEKDLVETFT